MAFPYTPASRAYEFIPGSGGTILLRNRNPATGVFGGSVYFDIRQWAIKQTYRNKNTTHSGSNGADLFTRVGAGWTFAAELSFPARLEPPTPNPGDEIATPFAEKLVGSLFGVGITFAVGNPQFWVERGLAIRSYRADKFLAQVIDTTNSARGDDEVQYNIVGVGSSLLGTYLDDTLQTPQLWF